MAKDRLDAGLRDLDHYRNRLPTWRYVPRRWLIPLMRWETPLLARCQEAVRTPALDSYFAITANLGTHTFFMVGLPILFWSGYTSLGRGMVQILASGVFFSGFLKDLLCLPRPLSPPLHRITMSGSAALEYGFPSTHSTNAVSVTLHVLFALNDPANTLPRSTKIMLAALMYFYATSIVLGRLYCGMHGFFDVVVGSLLGACLALIQHAFIGNFDAFIRDGSTQAIVIFILLVLVLVRIHPEPADDCPCFDDSVAFAGTLIGIEFGCWHFSFTKYSVNDPVPGTVPFDLHEMGWPKSIIRFVIGVAMIIGWRAVMKSLLLNVLPPLFRFSQKLGLLLPRKYFKEASEYDKVPQPIDTDNVMPRVTALPAFISSIRKRSRSISIGPQSEADAYEALAFRQKRRRESQSSPQPTDAEARIIRQAEKSEKPEVLRPARVKASRNELLPTPAPSDPDLVAKANSEAIIDSLLTPDDSDQSLQASIRTPSQDRREDEQDQREIFAQLTKPRVRYDVEVITKLIVYAGIGWIAQEGDPIFFQLIGLG